MEYIYRERSGYGEHDVVFQLTWLVQMRHKIEISYQLIWFLQMRHKKNMKHSHSKGGPNQLICKKTFH